MTSDLVRSWKDDPVDAEEMERIGERARREIRRLLQERPELAALQREIDRRLERSGNPQNRMAVLALMLESRLRDLQENLQKLAAARSLH